jgi:hypothetical protein
MNLLGVLLLLSLLLFSFVGLFFRNIRWIALVCLIASIGFTIVRWRIECNWTQAFDSIPKNATIDSVVKVAGKPTFISTDPRGPLGYSMMKDRPSIIREAWYISFFFPEQYVFGFDQRDLLIDRCHYSSP